MGGKHSRTKGHSFERAMAITFQKIFPNAKRKLEYQLSDCTGVDLTNTGDWKIQCKRLKKWASISKILEIKEDGKHLLITKGDRLPEIACLYLSDFVDLLMRVKILSEENKELREQIQKLLTK